MKLNEFATTELMERNVMDRTSVNDVINDPNIRVGFEIEAGSPHRDLGEIAKSLAPYGIDPKIHRNPGEYKPKNDGNNSWETIELEGMSLLDIDDQFDLLPAKEFKIIKYQGYTADPSKHLDPRIIQIYHAFMAHTKGLFGQEFNGDEDEADDVFKFLSKKIGMPRLAVMLKIYPKHGYVRRGETELADVKNPTTEQGKICAALKEIDVRNDEDVQRICDMIGKVTEVWNFHHVERDVDTNSPYKNWILTTDSSIEGGLNGIELVAPIMPLSKALSELQKLVNTKGADGEVAKGWMDQSGMKVNDSCSFHVSMSYENAKKTKRADFLKLGILLDEEQILGEFKRLGNRYTVSQIERIKHMVSDELKNSIHSEGLDAVLAKLRKEFNIDHYTSINIEHLKDRGYFEFRIIGGANYHQDFDKLKKLVLKYAVCLKAALDPNAFRNQYLTKLYKILDGQTKPSHKHNSMMGGDLLAKSIYQHALYPDAALSAYYEFDKLMKKFKVDGEAEDKRRALEQLTRMMIAGVSRKD
jgi:hypothetical protein